MPVRSIATTLCLCIAGLVGAQEAMALQATESSSFADAGQTDSGQQVKLQEVVVTAQKQVQLLQDVPVPVTVLSAHNLVEQNQVKLQDYFMSVPGLQMTPYVESIQQLSIRGITTSLADTPTVGIMIDGVPFGASQGFLGDVVPDLDPNDLKRIEVLRGPQGTLYGASSMGGLVNYVTVDPSTAAPSGSLEFGGNSVENGSAVGYSVRGSGNIPLSNTLAMRESGFLREDPGYVDDPELGRDGVNEAHFGGAHVGALWRPLEQLSVKVSALYQEAKGGSTNDVFGAPEYSPLQQYFIAGVGPFDRVTQAYSAIVTAELGPAELTSSTGYNSTKFTDSSDFTGVLGSLTQELYGVTGTPILDNNHVGKFSEELRLTVPFGQRLHWLLGSFFTHEALQASQSIPATNPTTGAVVNALGLGSSSEPLGYKDVAVFTDLTYQVTDRFDVQVGGRESHLEEAAETAVNQGPLFGDSVTPTQNKTADVFTYLVTPRFKISRDFMTYARLASGYRPGGSNGASQALPVHQYNPDKTKDYEIGTKGDFWDHRLSVDLSVYYIQWTNIQIQLRTAQQLGYKTNGASAKSQGVELSTAIQPIAGLTVSGWIALDQAVLTQALPLGSTAYGQAGDRLPFSPRVSGNLALEYRFPVGNLQGFLGSALNYQGDRLYEFTSSAASPRTVMGGYAKLDFHAGIQWKSWTASLYANNVANRRGVILADASNDPFGNNVVDYQLITPRTIGLNVTKAF